MPRYLLTLFSAVPGEEDLQQLGTTISTCTTF